MITRRFIICNLLLMAIVAPTQVFGGWVENATGGRLSTPKVIRDIAPNGIRVRRPGNNDVSGLTVLSPPFIDEHGNIHSGSSRSDYGQSIVGRAHREFDGQGRAWWRSNYRNGNGQVKDWVRAHPKYDRPARPTIRFIAPSQPLPSSNVFVPDQNSGISSNAFPQGQVSSNPPSIAPNSSKGQSTSNRPFLGVRVRNNPFGVGTPIGFVQPGSPASRAGLQVGDVVTRANGSPISTDADLRQAIAGSGGHLELQVRSQSGQHQRVSVPLNR